MPGLIWVFWNNSGKIGGGLNIRVYLTLFTDVVLDVMVLIETRLNPSMMMMMMMVVMAVMSDVNLCEG